MQPMRLLFAITLSALLGCTTQTTTERRVPSADGPDAPDAVGPAMPAARPAATKPDRSMFVCRMHPDVTADHAATCPKCGMTLVPLEKEADHATP